MSFAARRPAWFVVAAVLVFAAIGAGVAALRPSPFTAESVLLVPAGSNTVSPGSAEQAASLAQTYAQLIPRSQQLLTSVARQLNTSYTNVQGGVSATIRPGTSLVQVTYRDSQPQRATLGAQALTNLLAQGVPGVPAGAVTPVSASAAAALKGPVGTRKFAAVSLVVVGSGAGIASGSNADEANKLAVTFAGLIPADPAVVGLTAGRLGLSPDQVRSDLTIDNDANTSLLRVDFEGQSRAQAIAGATTVASAVAGPNPVASTLPAGSMTLVRLPTTTSTAYTTSTLGVIGALIGLALGLLAVMLLQRRNPRLKDPATTEAMLSVPAIDTATLSPGIAGSLMTRWREIALGTSTDGRARPNLPANSSVLSVALVPVSEEEQPAAEEIETRFLDFRRDQPLTRPQNGSADENEPLGVSGKGSPEASALKPGPALDRVRVQVRAESRTVSVVALSHQAVALDPGVVAEHDVIVFVAQRKTRAHEIAALLDLLAGVGRGPDWVMLVTVRSIGIARPTPDD
jgi:capsular polysaccharide biosynthesis protein